ncbi:unnamed protein product, partial [Agarophyton chilense]
MECCLTSLKLFGCVIVPREDVVRICVLRGTTMQQIGAQCNPHLTAQFYGRYSEFYTHNYNPITDDDTCNFFEVFERRVNIPGVFVRIEVEDRMLLEAVLPVSYQMMKITEEGSSGVGWVQRERKCGNQQFTNFPVLSSGK